MMRLLPYIFALLLGVGAALFAGCGDRSSLIPPQDATQLKSNIASVESAAANRDCGVSEKALSQARATVTNLPDGVDPRLRERLTTGLDRLRTKAQTECSQAPPTTTTEVPTTTTTTTTETTPTSSTETQQQQTTTDTAPSTPVDPTTTGTNPDGSGVPPDTSTTDTTPFPDPGGAAPVDPGSTGGQR
jgi:hypothetical protein